MVDSRYFPYYLPDKKEILKNRVNLMLTYEQILAVANALALLQKTNLRLFSGVRLSESELALNTSVHNACINCAMSLEELERSSNGKK
jgi:hypothetical protein